MKVGMIGRVAVWARKEHERAMLHPVRRHAIAMFGAWYWVVPALAGATLLGAWIAFPFIFQRFGHLSPFGWRPSLDVVAAVWLFGLAVAPATVWAAVYSTLWGRASRDLGRGVHCMACGFSLVGLPERDGRLRCPECGRDLDPASAGWSCAPVDRGLRGRHP